MDKGIAESDITVAGVGIDIQALERGKDMEPSATEQRMKEQKSGLKLLYIGRIEPRRAPLFADRPARPMCVRQTAMLRLHDSGDGDAEYVQQVQNAIKERGLEKYVSWQKKARQPQLQGVYRQADFFLLPTEYGDYSEWCCLRPCTLVLSLSPTPNGGSNMLVHNGENGVARA